MLTHHPSARSRPTVYLFSVQGRTDRSPRIKPVVGLSAHLRGDI